MLNEFINRCETGLLRRMGGGEINCTFTGDNSLASVYGHKMFVKYFNNDYFKNGEVCRDPTNLEKRKGMLRQHLVFWRFFGFFLSFLGPHP